MPHIIVQETVAANRRALYELTREYRCRLEWDSSVKRVCYDHGSVTILTGLVRFGRYLNPLRLTLEHIPLLFPSLLVSNMLSGPFFVSKVLASWRFEALDANITRVVLDFGYTTRWPIVRNILDPLLNKALTYMSLRLLSDLKHAAENTDILCRLPRRDELYL